MLSDLKSNLSNFLQAVFEDKDYRTTFIFLVFILIIVFILLYIISNNNNNKNTKPIMKLNDLFEDKTTITDNTQSNKDNINIDNMTLENVKAKNIHKIIIKDKSNDSLIQIKYTSNKNYTDSIKSEHLKKHFDYIFFEIAQFIDSEINQSKHYTIEKLINKFKLNKNYSKHFYFYDIDDSVTLEVILQFRNFSTTNLDNKNFQLNKNTIIKNIENITKLINLNTEQKNSSIDKIPINLNTKTNQNNLNKFIENLNESINTSLLKASETKEKKHMIIASYKIKFRNLFIKTNKLLINLDDTDKNNYLTKKNIDSNKKKLDILHKKIIYARIGKTFEDL
tara:strand:+ start:576 stop:1586 length:1011 start_codon:yes stop_codon:yes gene_type:complete